MRRIALLTALAVLTLPGVVNAGPVATSDPEYSAYSRVFPDPQGGVCLVFCSPHRQGQVPARTFISYGEFGRALRFMNQRPDWQRYMEVWPLSTGRFPGNDFGEPEFTPDPEYMSAGLPTTGLGRQRNQINVVRVTDERVPDAGKKRYVLSLSIHGIERAGAEGGTRAMEDLVTAATAGRLDEPILKTPGLGVPTPTFGEVLKKSIVYFTYPNPDGWRRGSVDEGGIFFQRYNGNGIDPNRDWPDIGYSFRPYSSLSEPETKAISSFLQQVKERHGRFAAGDDLHGQLGADSFSYTLLPHGSHDYAKNSRILDTAKTINLVQANVLSWSPLIQPNDAEPGTCEPVGGFVCQPMYGQTFGTVYDTINYTTTGALGDYFDSSVGLDADGIDNEMSHSHLDRNILFEPMNEQLHVDGNMGLIYAHLSHILNPRVARFAARGRKGYVPLSRVRRAAKRGPESAAPEGTRPQPDIDVLTPISSPAETTYEFEVRRDARTFNGGMRVDITRPNAQGIDPAQALNAGGKTFGMKVQCRGCDRHPGAPEGEWSTVTEDFNQSGLYLQAGVTAAVNYPQASAEGKPVRWRAVVQAPLGAAIRVRVDFTSGPAATSGETGGGEPPTLAAYDVASTDFWQGLNQFAPRGSRFARVDADRLARRREARVPQLDTLVLTDEALPGYVAPGGESARPSRYTQAQHQRYARKLSAFASRGGNLVLTDGALRLLPDLFPSIRAEDVRKRVVYVGQVAFGTTEIDSIDPRSEGNTLEDPLARNVSQQGARFNSGLRRQTFEPTPIGYAIQDPKTGADQAHTPQWEVERGAFEKAGGRIVGLAPAEGTGAGVAPSAVVLGEISLGRGVVRILGALLPQPSEAFDHEYGLEPHAVTYTGYFLAENLTDHCRPGGCRPVRRPVPRRPVR